MVGGQQIAFFDYNESAFSQRTDSFTVPDASPVPLPASAFLLLGALDATALVRRARA